MITLSFAQLTKAPSEPSSPRVQRTEDGYLINPITGEAERPILDGWQRKKRAELLRRIGKEIIEEANQRLGRCDENLPKVPHMSPLVIRKKRAAWLKQWKASHQPSKRTRGRIKGSTKGKKVKIKFTWGKKR